jgi:dTDP-4-dehydrorhamnose reductase
MRVMLLGAGGMLGHDLVATVPAAVTLLPFTKGELDITDATALAATIARVKPDVVMNAAAYTAVDRAETERDLAFRVNAEAVGALGRIARQAHLRVIHFSTDYVFDGSSKEPYTEDSPTNPINVYGASKLAGEAALRESGADLLVVRTQWLFGANGRSFPRTMWERAAKDLATRVVNDQTGKPTYTVDLAEATWRLAQDDVVGILHVANSGSASWYGLASHIFQRVGKWHLVAGCASADYPTAARRPPNSILNTARADALLGYRLPDWRSAVEQFISSAREEECRA